MTKPDLPGNPKTVGFDGFELTIDPRQSELSKQLSKPDQPIYEPPVMAVFDRLPFDGITFFDVGANYGYYSLMLASRCENHHVVAFEPHPKNLQYLRWNTSMNGFDFQISPKAVSNAVGEAVLYDLDHDDNKTLASDKFYPDYEQPPEILDKLTVETTTLEATVDDLNVESVDCVKVDVEGAEHLVLEGVRSWERFDGFLVELHGTRMVDFGTAIGDIPEMMSERGFEVVVSEKTGGPKFARIEETNLKQNGYYHLLALRPSTSVYSQLMPHIMSG
jgi:FkbM family methyltransferase